MTNEDRLWYIAARIVGLLDYFRYLDDRWDGPPPAWPDVWEFDTKVHESQRRLKAAMEMGRSLEEALGREPSVDGSETKRFVVEEIVEVLTTLTQTELTTVPTCAMMGFGRKE